MENIKKQLLDSPIDSNDDKFNNWYQISDNILALSISKCGCSTIGYLACLYKGIKEIDKFKDKKYKSLCTLWTSCVRKLEINITNRYQDKKLIVIYRDPIERLVSAYTTIGKGMPIEEYFKQIDYAINNNIVINYHIQPQIHFIQNNNRTIDDIDLFIELKDLKSFIQNELDIYDSEMNMTPPDKKITNYDDLIKPYIGTFMNYYKEDYDMIANIPDSKKYKPKDNG